MSKKKDRSKEAVSEKKEKDSSKILDFIDKNRYLPYIVFTVLAVIYFAPLIFSNYSLNTTDGGVLGYGETVGLEYFDNPFKEEIVWEQGLGGMPTAPALKEFNLSILYEILNVFFYDFRANSFKVIFVTILAAVSMFVFLRGININKSISILLAVGYQLSPHFMSFTHAGHFSKMGVIAVLPLLFHFLKKGLDTGKIKYFLWFGFFIGIDIFFAHLQMVHFSLLVTGFYFVFRLIYDYIKNRDLKWVGRAAGLYLIVVVLGFGMGARGFAPQFEHTRTVSKRAGQAGEGLSIEYATTWALHSEEIASLAVPEFGNYDVNNVQRFYWGKNPFKLNADYFGGILFVLSFLALVLIK